MSDACNMITNILCICYKCITSVLLKLFLLISLKKMSEVCNMYKKCVVRDFNTILIQL